jgi:recombination protein RecR
LVRVPAPLERLIAELSKFPGVGEKTAMRYAFHVLRESTEGAEALARALVEVKTRLRYCEVCFHIAEAERCGVCLDPHRDPSVLCVVEDVPDLLAIERMGEFRGRYHVLHGVLAPLRGIGPDEIRMRPLFARLRAGGIAEVIVATNVGVEGEATGLYIKHVAQPLGVRTTRIASGIPMGGDLEYIDQVTLSRALDGRREL